MRHLVQTSGKSFSHVVHTMPSFTTLWINFFFSLAREIVGSSTLSDPLSHLSPRRPFDTFSAPFVTNRIRSLTRARISCCLVMKLYRWVRNSLQTFCENRPFRFFGKIVGWTGHSHGESLGPSHRSFKLDPGDPHPESVTYQGNFSWWTIHRHEKSANIFGQPTIFKNGYKTSSISTTTHPTTTLFGQMYHGGGSF
jgi:hypothetical protein